MLFTQLPPPTPTRRTTINSIDGSPSMTSFIHHGHPLNIDKYEQSSKEIMEAYHNQKHSRVYRRLHQPTLIMLWCTLLLLLILQLQTVHCREADDRSRFLYADDPRATVILEYQLHNAPSKDYSGDERKKAAKEQPGSEYDEERHIKPYFLMPDNIGPRVVQYYSPWCG